MQTQLGLLILLQILGETLVSVSGIRCPRTASFSL